MKDFKGVMTLTILYLYQGLVLGLPAGGLQIILTERNVSYSKIGMFSFCAMPFAIKFLWSPLLDYYFIERIGKRKTYIVPANILIGMLFLYLE